MKQYSSNKISVTIVDDEPIAADGLSQLLENDEDLVVAGVFYSAYDALEFLKAKKTDILFLDIQMPGMSGFELLRSLPAAELPVTVFVTAYDKYALRAFEVNALDYLLKPFDDKRFFLTLNRAKAYCRLKQNINFSKKLDAVINFLESEGTRKESFMTRIPVKKGSEIFFLNTCDIDWITANDYYVDLHSRGKKYLLRESMTKLESQLDPSKFIRIHRCTIINVDRIRSVQHYFNSESVVITLTGERFRMSRSRKEVLLKKLGLK